MVVFFPVGDTGFSVRAFGVWERSRDPDCARSGGAGNIRLRHFRAAWRNDAIAERGPAGGVLPATGSP